MDIKEKLKTFIDKQKTTLKTPHVNAQDVITQDDFEGKVAIISQYQRLGINLDEHKLTPEAEKAVIDSIEPAYFEVNGEDVGELELKKFPDITDIHVINGIRSRLRKQQSVVTRRVSSLILQKQGLCSKEIESISEIQQEICKAISLCTEGRTKLKQGRTQFTSASLGILSNYSKRRRVADVIESLQTIQTLQMTDVQLQALLKDEDYPGAIHLLLECQKAAATFKHFHCISELSSKLQDTLELVEEQLDSAVSRVALNYNESLYEKLFIAYGLFNKTQIMMDQLHMHLTSHIHNTAFNIILGYVELYNSSGTASNGNTSGSYTYSKLQHTELCKYINQECFLACFYDLSKGMWNILKNYYNIIKWHKEKGYRDKDENEDREEKGNLESNYIKQKLDYGLIRLWQDVQAKVRTYILASDLSHFKFDDFVKVLEVINKLIKVGEAFSGSPSETLQDSIKKQSLSFFQSHHSTEMEWLHRFLKNEGWEICPVKSTFQINQLIEFKFLKDDIDTKRHSTPVSSPKKGFQDTTVIENMFEAYSIDTPFDLTNDESIEEDIMADDSTENALSEEDSDEELSEELKRDFVDEPSEDKTVNCIKKKKELNTKTPMITITTLNVLRLFGKYIQRMMQLRPIAFDVLRYLIQLFEYYLYTVFTLFSCRNTSDPHLSPRLRTTLKKIEEGLIQNDEVSEEEVVCIKRIPMPSLCDHILKDSPETLYSLPVRVVAAESLSFLSQQLELLQSSIESLIPSSKTVFLQQFYADTVNMTSEVRSHVYMYVASKVVDYESLLNQMIVVRWDIFDLRSEHSSYVDLLLRQLQILSIRIDELRRTHPIPDEAVTCLWENVVRCTHMTLLEGFASARKCSNEGRSLMQLDYQQFLMKLETLTTVRPLPDRHLVDDFIKAYYLPENELEEWVRAKQTLYSTKQLMSLTNCMTHVSKKTRQRIGALLGGDNF